MITNRHPKAKLVPTVDERGPLKTLAAHRKSAQALAHRAQIVLRRAEGMTNTAVAAEETVTMQAVCS